MLFQFKKQIKIFALFVFIATNFLFFPLASLKAEEIVISPEPISFSLLPDKELFFDPNFFYLDVTLAAGNNTVNAVKFSLSFATGSLELIASSTQNSACSLVAINEINNDSGNYNLECGLVPGIYDNIFLTRLVFKKLEPGFAKLAVNNNSAILAHDGLGTNLLDNREIHNVFIVK
jgi:hypothetical protein